MTMGERVGCGRGREGVGSAWVRTAVLEDLDTIYDGVEETVGVTSSATTATRLVAWTQIEIYVPKKLCARGDEWCGALR